MLVAITGSSGYIGKALDRWLLDCGHQTVSIRRGPASDPMALWEPSSGWVRPGAFDDVDAVVHLSGVSIAQRRWTAGRKALLRASRVDSTAVLAQHLASLPVPPRVLFTASGVGYYGEGGEEILSEATPQGAGFLAELVADWEAAAAPAQTAGIRTVHGRFGPLVGPGSELVQRLSTPFRMGVGGPLGNGRQWFPWVSTDDVVRAIELAITSDEIEGPMNVVAPTPVRNREFTSALGRQLHRPAVLPIPGFALAMLFGRELVSETLLTSQRVEARVLESARFTFRHSTIDTALASAFEQRAATRVRQEATS